MTNYQLFKQELVTKLREEGAPFTARDIKKVKDTANGFSFVVGDYTHIVFTVSIVPEKDTSFAEHFGRLFCSVYDNFLNESCFGDWFNDEARAIHRLAYLVGYQIATTF